MTEKTNNGGNNSSKSESGSKMPSHWRRGVAALIVWASAVTGVGAWAIQDLHAIQEQIATELVIEDARRCATAWDQRLELRQLVVQASNETAFATNTAVLEAARLVVSDPESIDEEVERQFNEATARQLEPVIDRLVDAYPDPSCDPEEALSILEDNNVDIPLTDVNFREIQE